MKATIWGFVCLSIILSTVGLYACGDEISYGVDSGYTADNDGGMDNPDASQDDSEKQKNLNFVKKTMLGNYDYICNGCNDFVMELTNVNVDYGDGTVYSNCPENLIGLRLIGIDIDTAADFCLDPETMILYYPTYYREDMRDKPIGQVYLNCDLWKSDIQSQCLAKPAQAQCQPEMDCGKGGVRLEDRYDKYHPVTIIKR